MGNQVAHQDGRDVLVHGYHFGHYSNVTYSARYLIDGSVRDALFSTHDQRHQIL